LGFSSQLMCMLLHLLFLICQLDNAAKTSECVVILSPELHCKRLVSKSSFSSVILLTCFAEHSAYDHFYDIVVMKFNLVGNLELCVLQSCTFSQINVAVVLKITADAFSMPIGIVDLLTHAR
jgi:hypothetical protein